MSPAEINTKFGKPVWTCATCGTAENLHWWNGLSVAICQQPECSNRFSEMCLAQEQAEQSYQDYVREHYGDAR